MAEQEHTLPPGDCILFATADWDEPYWTNKQHTASELAKMGWRVLYIESVGLRSPKAKSRRDWQRLKARLFKGLRSLMLGAPERAPGIFVLSPLVVPAGHRHPLLRRLNRALLKIAIARSLWGRKFQHPLIWTYHPFMLDVVAGMDKGPLLYHCVDDLAAVPGVDAATFREAEDELLRRADVVFATAPALAERCRTINPNTHFLPNVVDAEHFGKALQSGPIPSDLACIPEPRLCYHGVLSDFKIDFQLLLDCARLKPEWSWVLIGEEREGQKSPLVAELARLPNVYFLGYKPYAQLPDYLRGMQVGLLPSLINDYTRGMFPMKYYEYLAAGLPVAATPLDFAKASYPGLQVAVSLDGFMAVISSQLQCKGNRKELAQELGRNTWQRRTLSMLNALRDTVQS